MNQRSLEEFRNLEADIAILKNVNEKLLQRITTNERQCRANTQYSRRERLEVVDVPASASDTALGDRLCYVFYEIEVEVGERDIQSCHPLKN